MSKSGVFLLGLAIGIGAGVGVSSLLLKKYYSEQAEEEIKSVKELYGRVYKIDPKDVPTDGKKIVVASIDSPTGSSKKSLSEIREVTEIVNYNQYAKLVRERTDDVVMTDEPDPDTYNTNLDGAPSSELDDDELGAIYPSEGQSDPYHISKEEYEHDSEYEKCELLYYGFNDALVNEEDEQVARSLVGDENLDFSADDDETGERYIRNERLGTDYLVLYAYGEWTGKDYEME